MSNTPSNMFAGNPAIDTAIKEMLPAFDSGSQRRIRKAILHAKAAAERHRDENTDAGARHIFRELIPAARLNRSGFNLEYEKPIDGTTPDWLDDRANVMMECYTYERGGSTGFHTRVNAAVANKCSRYAPIIHDRGLLFVVAVYLDFMAAVTVDECLEDVEQFRPVFDANDALSALLFFSETRVVANRQEYGFGCLSAGPAVPDLANWPFDTQCLNP